ncbi:hypothetical protein H5410_002132 [Solanum commersonii]|uniref:Uncharacterized protein n=1 Tax=Solanum commersonii TaxID=4109 RepID=A0A9J6B211_SOLCO|nr:hypothetical protein H5410_002132 [Solanum commersonii]
MGFCEPSIREAAGDPLNYLYSDFLSLLDLHIFRSLRHVDGGHVELDYLFQWFRHSEDLEIGEESWCTPEYYAWRNIVSHMAHPSAHGHWGFVDRQQIDWIRESVLPRMVFTTPMYNQIVPRSIDYLIQKEDPEEDPDEDPRRRS